MLVLLSGLPRLLVHCLHLDGGSSIEFLHDDGICCLPPGAAELPALPGDEPSLGAHYDCEHSSLAIDHGNPPRPVLPATPGATAWLLPQFGPATPTDADDRGRRPPQTGPPRPDHRTALRHSTLLLL